MNAPPASAPPRGRPLSEAKHSELLWAAAQLFAQRGIAGTPTRDIAARAGTTERTLFKHFGSKDGLVQAVLHEAVLSHFAPVSLAQLEAGLRAFAGDLPAWHAKLLSDRLAALAAGPELLRLLVVEMLRDEQVLARFADGWKTSAWAPLLDLFGALQAEGRMRRDVPAPVLVRQFLSLNLGFLVARVLLAPAYAWDDAPEIGAIAHAFAAISAPRGP